MFTIEINFGSLLRRWSAVLLTSGLLMTGGAIAQDADEAESIDSGPVVLQPLTEEVSAELVQFGERLAADRGKIDDIEARARAADEPVKGVLEARLDRAWIKYLQGRLEFASRVAEEEEADFDVADFRPAVTEILDSQSDIANVAISRLARQLVLPAADLAPLEQAAGYRKFFAIIQAGDDIFDTFLASVEVSKRFDLDVSQDVALLEERLTDRAINTSVFLELSIANVDEMRAGLSALPDDAEIKARLVIAEDRLRQSAAALERLVQQMQELGLDTAEYQEQVITATGAITADIFDFQVIGNLLGGWGNAIIETLLEDAPSFLFQVLLFLFIIYAFRKLADIVQRLVERGLKSAKFPLTQLLRRMIISSVRNLVLIVGVLIALSQMGISLGPLLAGLGIAGFVIGFALQDSLANFASGMMILFYRPFDVGDVVDVGGAFGKVRQMTLVNTTIMTLDNQMIVVPNNMIWSGVVKNLTNQTTRRVDLTFGVSYSDDLPKVERILKEIVDAHDKVMDDPEPMIHLHELGDSSVNYIVRPWVASDDYWDVYWDIIRAVKMRFDEEGISIPFPQRDVHIFNSPVADET